jgi:hypothetical protein
MPLLFEFPSSRLFPRSTAGGSLYYSFIDPYGTLPFVYFSAYNNPNGYNRYFSQFGNSDCVTLATVWPYAEAVPLANPGGNLIPGPRYINPETFQIISAGRDGIQLGGGFGSGTILTGQISLTDPRITGGPTWTSATASQTYPPGTPGADDMSSFCDTLLGSGG